MIRAEENSKPRRTGFYWVKLSPVISGGWEVAHWSAAFRNWTITGKDNQYKPSFIEEVDENRLEHPNWEE